MRVLLPLLLLLAASPRSAAEPPTHEEARYVMGTIARVAAWADDPAAAAAAVDSAFAAFDRVERRFSTWRPDSELSRLNARAGRDTVPVSPELAHLLDEALRWAELSGGAFDPTVLPLVELWGFREDGPVDAPTDSAVASTLDRVGWENVIRLRAPDRVAFARDGMALDLGGIAKGHALDLGAAALRAHGARGGLLDLGGGVFRFGEGPPREVSIVDPAGGAARRGALELGDGAVATSGQYERYRTADGRTWGHILDPRTGRPCDHLLGVTVRAATALAADVLSTAVFVLGRELGSDLVAGIPECEAVFMTPADAPPVRVAGDGDRPGS